MKRGTPKHPKVYALCSLLKVKRTTAIGILELLWHMCAEYTPQGDIGKYDDDWIEASLDWTGRKGHLINCLVEAGWLDREPATTKEFVDNGETTARQWPGNRKLFVHHWHDHADSVVQKRLERAHLPFLTVREKVTGQNPVTDQFSAASRARDPIPSLPVQADHPPTPSEASELCPSDDGRAREFALAKTPRSGDGYRPEEAFEPWFELYPRKMAKARAKKAFLLHVKTEEHFQQVMAATQALLPGMLALPEDKRRYAARWLNEKGWLDPVEPPAARKPPQSSVVERTKAKWAQKIAKGERPI